MNVIVVIIVINDIQIRQNNLRKIFQLHINTSILPVFENISIYRHNILEQQDIPRKSPMSR